MIEIENVRIDEGFNALVTDGALRLIETKWLDALSIQIDGKNHMPIITSTIEKIVEGDWFLDTTKNTIQKAGVVTNNIYSGMNFSKCHGFFESVKIIALAEHFSLDHKLAILNGKLKDRDSLVLEVETLFGCDNLNCPKSKGIARCLEQGKPTLCDQNSKNVIKLNSNKHFTSFHLVEEEKFTVGQIVEYLNGYTDHTPISYISNNIENGDLSWWFKRKLG